MQNINLIFGKRIRDLRIASGMSQEKMAEKCDLHHTYIGQLERGEKSPSLDSIYKISCGLEIDICSLFENLSLNGNNENVPVKDYAKELYNEVLALSNSKKKKMYSIVCSIIEYEK